MKKAIIKALSVVLVVVITLTSAPLSGFVGLELPKWLDFSIKSSAATSGACGDNLTWSYDTSTKTLTISGTGNMYNYSSSNSPWNSYKDSIKKVVINNGVTTIGNYAFTYCESLTSVTIPNSVTTIGDGAIGSCNALTSIIIPESVISIGVRAFSYCNSLTSIEVSESNTAYSSVGGVLLDKNKTTLIQYPIGNTRTSYTIPNGVTSISDNAFSWCISLTSVTISDSVTTICNGAFRYCDALATVIIGNSVTIIGDSAFSNCSSLTSVTIPDSVTTIGDYAFTRCASLTKITIPNNVTAIGGKAFLGCESLTRIDVSSGNSVYASVDGVLFNKNKTILIEYPIGNTRTSYTIPNSVTSIGERAFYSCDAIASVTIGDNVMNIGEAAFIFCGSLTNVKIGNGIKIIEEAAFANCSSIPNVSYSGTDAQWKSISIGLDNTCLTKAYESIKNSFYNGELENGLTWEVSGSSLIIRGAGEYIPSFDMGEAPWSRYASQIEKIYLFTEYVETIGAYAFYGLENVDYINIGSDSLKNVGKYAFGGINVGIDIWYYGSDTQWKNVKIDYGNDTLIGSNVHCSKNDSTVGGQHVSKPSANHSSKSFIDEHLSFVQDTNKMNMLNENSFNNVAVVDRKVLHAYNVWDVLGDVGEIVTLNFNNLTINADYYEMYLSDMILALNNEEEVSKLEWKVAEVYNDVYGGLKKFLKVCNEWESSITPSVEKEIDDLFNGKIFEVGDETSEFLAACFEELNSSNPNALVSIFDGLSTASNVLDGVFAAFDIVNAYVDAYNAYVVSKAFYEVNDEFFDVCISAGKRLQYSDYSQYGKWFLNAVYEAKKSEIGNLAIIFNAAHSLSKSSKVIVYDMFIKKIVEVAVYPTVAKLLGLASAGQWSLLALTYNVTYGILDAVTGLSKASVQYKIVNYITPVEKQLSEVVASKRNTLLSAKSESSAISYDMAYRILRHTNMYLYEATYKHAAIKNNTNDMTHATAGKNLWNRTMCHNGNYGGKYNIFSSRCPVDVYVYDSNGMLVTSVIDEKVVEYDYRITVMTGNGHKSFAYPSDEEFTFVVKAREEGEMDYSFGTLDCATLETEYSSYDVELEPGQEFSTTIPVSNDECSDDFKLETNDTYIEFDYDSTQICETHTFGEWINGEENKSRVCTVCGYVEYVAVCSHNFETVEVYSIVPTCLNGGHTFYACIGCGQKMNEGVDVGVTEHNYLDGTCTTCGINKPIAQEMSSQIRFDRNEDGSYAETFAVRTRAMISDEDFTELVGATTEEAIKNIDKIGFVYTLDGENFSAKSAQAVAQGEKVAGYTDAPVSYVQDADGYYMFTCLVTDIPDTDKEYTMTAYAYICVNGKWYFSEAPMNADFNNLYSTYYPLACEKYGWEA